MEVKNYLIGLIAISFLAMFSCSDDLNDQNTENLPQEDETSELVTLKSGVVVKQSGDKYFFQDDILLSDEQLKLLDEIGDFVPSKPVSINKENMIPVSPAMGYDFIPYPNEENLSTRSTAIYPTSYNMWAMVRFTYAHKTTGTKLNSYTRSLIKQALEYWEANTNVRFYNATDDPTKDPTYGFNYPYVNFCDGADNASYVGRIDGRQDLTLVPYGCSVGIIIHEIGHAIGLLHEQCRYDRDNYIIVNTNNIIAKHQHNFTKRSSNYYCIGAFDFNSIMMYSSYTGFEINSSKPSMTKKDGVSTWVGQRSRLSNDDRKFPNTFYLPYTARRDVYRELAPVVYKPDNTIMTASERLQLQAQLNNGNPNPPANGRIPNNF